ncbi:DUF1996 domain-containing protein [Streptomyces chromofuscus]|uniref:DUF1996 domain-containing protein n=1 Tax=Streptomyces chromofuscus TaxID=42881 RepID=A0A7M2TI97_STRCW|nr:DUF1996 domain-containing protein [Streptomyces chromofuscus]
MLGGGGLVGVNVYASATDGGSGGDVGDTTSAWGTATIDCPDVGERLTAVPDAARAEVDKELALLDQQIADAYRQLQQQSTGSAEEAVVQPLTEQRAATIERIALALDNAGERPDGLEALAACTLQEVEGAQDPEGEGQAGDGSAGAEGDGQADGGDQAGDGQGGIGGQAGNGPVAADYADITGVQPNVPAPQQTEGASRGTFTTSCGVNAEGLFNSDNVIVAPGVTNGAHHFHDYVGNQANNAFAGDEDLAAAETSCVDPGDRSSYYWPVLRLQNGTQEQDAQSPGGGVEGNAGEIVTPKEVTLTFVGNPLGEVTAMPRLLRIITGDAKAFVNGPANANASWSCTGFEDRQLKDKYPLCPSGSDVVRTFRFQSCWDGSNIDSANHRTHVAFADASGNCPAGFRAIPQLVQRIVYDVDAPSLNDGGRTTPLFAVDSFPEQLHKPVTDHGDFINVFDEDLMAEMVDCINGGRQCQAGAGDGDGDGGGQDEPTDAPQDPGAGDGGAEQPGDGGAGEQPAEPGDGGGEQPAQPGDGGGDRPGDDAGGEAGAGVEPTQAPDDEAPAPSDGTPETTAPRPVEPKAASTSAVPSPAATSRAPAAAAGTGGSVTGASAGQQVAAPQGEQGGLAETGASLWPAAAGSALLLAGGVLLMRTRRRQR